MLERQKWWWSKNDESLVRPQKSANLPNWTGGGTTNGGRVALEVKLFIGTLGGPHELPGAPKGPPRGPKWPKMTITVKKLKKHNRINNQGPFFVWFHSQVMDFEVKVNMETQSLVWGTVGGQKWPKMSQKIQIDQKLGKYVPKWESLVRYFQDFS